MVKFSWVQICSTPVSYTHLKLKEVIQEADPNVFILITDAQEVIGQGFTQPIIPTEVCEQLKNKSTTQEDNTEIVHNQ